MANKEAFVSFRFLCSFLFWRPIPAVAAFENLEMLRLFLRQIFKKLLLTGQLSILLSSVEALGEEFAVVGGEAFAGG